MFVWKTPAGQQFLKYSEQPIWQQEPCHVQSLKSNSPTILMLSLNFSSFFVFFFDDLYMPKYTNI